MTQPMRQGGGHPNRAQICRRKPAINEESHQLVGRGASLPAIWRSTRGHVPLMGFEERSSILALAL